MARTESLSIGGGMAGATAGSVIFAGTGGVLAQDNSSIFFDDTNNRLGLMTTAPTHTLTLGSTGTGIAIYNTVDQTTNYERVLMSWATNVFLIESTILGTGTIRPLRLQSGGVTNKINFTLNRNTSPYAQVNTAGSGPNGNGNTLFNVSGELGGSSAVVLNAQSITPTINQSSTAGYTALLINPTESATGSGAKNLILAQVGGVTKFSVDNTGAFSCSNPVTAGIAVASTHRIAVVDGGTTYYLLATTVA